MFIVAVAMMADKKKPDPQKQLEIYIYRFCPYCNSRNVYHTGQIWQCHQCQKKWKSFKS